MKKIIVIHLFVSSTLSIYAQQLSQEDVQYVDSVMKASYKPNEPGAVLLIAKGGKPVYRKAYGLANLELNVPNKPEYIFAIGSMSKQFLAVCILKLAEQGKLSLKDEITKYLPGYDMHGTHITIENLLTHTSGIINHFSVEGAMLKTMLNQSPQDLMHIFVDQPLFFKPGTEWSYSNSNYILLGLIVERISGMSLSEYLQQNIFDPLSMSNTHIGNHDSVQLNAVTGYDFAGPGKFKAPYQSWSWFYGAGQIITNVDDLLKWDNALYAGKIIAKDWFDKAVKSFVLPNGQLTNYGFAFTVNDLNGIRFIDHGGSTVGFNCDGIKVPSQQLYIVILSNTTTHWSPGIASTVALRLTKQTFTSSSSSVNKKILPDYNGVFALQRQAGYTAFDSANGPIYRYFIAKQDTLYETSSGGDLAPMLYVSKDLFVTKWGNPYYEFHRDNKNDIISVEIYSKPIQNGPREWKMKTNLPLPKPKQSITLSINQLKMIKGKYDFGGGIIIPVTIEGNRVYMQQPGQAQEEIFAENPTHFFSKGEATVEFIMDKEKVTGMIVNVGVEYEGKKIE